MKRYELAQRQWAVQRDLMPGKVGNPGRRAADNEAGLIDSTSSRRTSRRRAEKGRRARL